MSVNYVRGLKRVRASYPLAFSPTGAYDPSNKLHIGSTAIVGGSGVSTDYPEISSIASGRFLEWHFKTTNTGSGEVYGEYLSLQSGGTGTGYAYAYGALAKSVSGGYVAELAACYFKTQLSAGTVTGQTYVGFFEFIVDSAVANMSSGGCLQLVDIVSGALNADHGYMCLRTYGTYPFSNLLNIKDHTIGTKSATVLVSTINTAATNWTHGIKIRVGTTIMWLMATTTTPAA